MSEQLHKKKKKCIYSRQIPKGCLQRKTQQSSKTTLPCFGPFTVYSIKQMCRVMPPFITAPFPKNNRGEEQIPRFDSPSVQKTKKTKNHLTSLVSDNRYGRATFLHLPATRMDQMNHSRTKHWNVVRGGRCVWHDAAEHTEQRPRGTMTVRECLQGEQSPG